MTVYTLTDTVHGITGHSEITITNHDTQIPVSLELSLEQDKLDDFQTVITANGIPNLHELAVLIIGIGQKLLKDEARYEQEAA